MDIEKVLDDIIRIEGGYVNHPNDKGGPTNFGITQATLSQWLKRPATIEDVRNLKREVAEDIYLKNYFDGPGIHRLPSNIQPVMLDMSINHGPGNAIKILQNTLNLAGFTCTVDGGLGPQTRKLAEEADKAMGPYLVNAICEYREHFFNQIVARNPSQAVFLKGWLNRAKHFRQATQQ